MRRWTFGLFVTGVALAALVALDAGDVIHVRAEDETGAFGIQPGHAPDAFLELTAAAAGKIASAQSVFEDQIASKKGLFRRPIERHRAGRMPRCMNHFKTVIISCELISVRHY